jgi:hypothetical protein
MPPKTISQFGTRNSELGTGTRNSVEKNESVGTRQSNQCAHNKRHLVATSKMSSSRLTRLEAESLMLNIAMDRLAKDTDFRTLFLHKLMVLKSVIKTMGEYKLGASDTALRRWSAVCLVASAIHARSSEAWEEFKEAHFRKIESRWEVGILIDLWVKHTDIEKALEVFSGLMEEGEIDEGEYLRQMDLTKFAYELREEFDSNPKLCVRVGPNPEMWVER